MLQRPSTKNQIGEESSFSNIFDDTEIFYSNFTRTAIPTKFNAITEKMVCQFLFFKKKEPDKFASESQNIRKLTSRHIIYYATEESL